MVWHIIRANILLIVNLILTDRIRMSLNTLTKKLPENFFLSLNNTETSSSMV